MKHWVIAYRRVSGAPADLRRRLRSDITDLLRAALDADEERAEPDGSLLLQLPARVIGRDVSKQVRFRTGVAIDHGARTCVPLQWEAEPARHAFPVFRGTVELEPMTSGIAQLAVVGAVTPPLGPVGALADATVLGALAERTTHDLADRLADALEAPPAADRRDEHGERSAGVRPRLSVGDVMTADPVVLYEDMPLRTAALLLYHFDVSGAPVRTTDGGLVGVLSESDVLAAECPPDVRLGRRAAQRRALGAARTVGEACGRPARTVPPDTDLAEAASMMWDDDIGRLVVVSGAEIVGIVSRHDVLRAVIRNDAETQTAVDQVLRERDAQGVVVDVEWGVATVKGSVDRHSTARWLVDAIRAVDGVNGVDTDLEWLDDDLVPPVVP
ncbi:MAG TPA: CBS domain-containing protein [Euzebyales bacterium]